jgi:hypothetical protein
VLSAFVIGTLAPDFEYFARIAPQSRVGHVLPGLVVLTFPVGLLALWIFHAFTKQGLVTLLPDDVGRRIPLGKFEFKGLRRFVAVCASMWLGIASHLLWDEFTHRDSWASAHVAFLRIVVMHVNSYSTATIADVLQLISSGVGLGVVIYWIAAAYRHSKPLREASPTRTWRRTLVWLILIALPSVFFGYWRARQHIGPLLWDAGDRIELGMLTVIGAIAITALSITLVGAVERIRQGIATRTALQLTR